ncbi:putative E3 ubiquitin-protein ligase XBAT31 [Cucurbita argyrosperma subsp. argyrosperma]|nr:putative E3 ubiquitin-protein ligase XBAT31 [Cucurbita argyrosperma subsp. argyrosperma]
MGQGLSCSASHENGLFSAVQCGDLEIVRVLLKNEPSLLHNTTLYDRQSPLHIAAANGQIEILSLLLERFSNPDLLNRHKQTPLMLAAMHGKISCVKKLLEVGANILKFDSLHGRTCLHYAAHYGHFDCLEAILSAAQSSSVSASWGFVRFVNIRDGKGATPLHLAARQRRPECIHILLDNGALVSASTGGYGYFSKSTLLNPSSTEPLVWPSPLKFINELHQEAKALLEQALMEANREREKSILKATPDTVVDNLSEISDGDTELCTICFEQAPTIEVQSCGHVMCAQCTLSLCCHSKPNPSTACVTPPVCPFCRSNIIRLVVAKTKTMEEVDDHETNSSSKQRKGRKGVNLSDGDSSSLKGLSSMTAFGKMNGGRGSGRIAAADDDQSVDKLG